MQREIQVTADGSHTIAIPEMKVTYHSHHGAIEESMHIYIKAGLHTLLSNPQHITPLSILEIGFGTGLNALLSLREANALQQHIQYTAIEPFPLSSTEIAQINHGNLLSLQEDFLHIHQANWEQDIIINKYFSLKKMNRSLSQPLNISAVNCIYFDAFSPTVQPELWTKAVFEEMYQLLVTGGILVTYCSKTVVRKAMEAAGFTVTKITGPYGKRDIVRAEKRNKMS